MNGYDLAIDTAGHELGLALVAAGEPTVVTERRWRLDSTVSEELLAALDVLLRDAEVSRESLRSIAVNVGPGGYSGLRGGVATAQGMALALDIPLAGVARLEADAYPHLLARAVGAPVVAVHDAGRSGIAWAAYALPMSGAAPSALTPPRIDTAAAAATAAPAGALWCGELTDALRAALDAAADREPTTGDTVPRAAADLVHLARLHGAYGDPALVDVVYLRPPSITRPKS
ncbi:MAG: tRNA (adenosine(37)-N6)-threonylcarbamoyltransferase complex dimerization subunit type 1 TsaB [Chloroflexi bacterium]|nr:tRNA (adenosine(37)-N6)-threonylcarbamoyltransferase complex dimerization subunit type 1 TsaB [Chloroflexota bacterium]